MNIFIQDNAFRDSQVLHEKLLDEFKNAIYGTGVYAFASQDGVDLIFNDQEFVNFIASHKFDLIVGTDAITNSSAVNKLIDLSSQYHNFKVYAYLNKKNGSLFHPKVSWFKKLGGGVVIIGSGNLTVEGLRKNKEMFGIINLSPSEIHELENKWKNWLLDNRNNVREITDSEVIERVKKNNNRKEWNVPESIPEGTEGEFVDQKPEKTTGGAELRDEWTPQDNDEVLVIEIPKASTRWNQANFDIESFEKFFGGIPGSSSAVRILLRSIKDDRTLGDLETRPGVSVASQNYRIELAAASRRNYPVGGRPIGIFIKIATRMFIYRLTLPGDVDYDEISVYLDDINIQKKAGRMRKGITDVKSLKANVHRLSNMIMG